jgi:hypothetical protein
MGPKASDRPASTPHPMIYMSWLWIKVRPPAPDKGPPLKRCRWKGDVGGPWGGIVYAKGRFRTLRYIETPWAGCLHRCYHTPRATPSGAMRSLQKADRHPRDLRGLEVVADQLSGRLGFGERRGPVSPRFSGIQKTAREIPSGLGVVFWVLVSYVRKAEPRNRETHRAPHRQRSRGHRPETAPLPSRALRAA